MPGCLWPACPFLSPSPRTQEEADYERRKTEALEQAKIKFEREERLRGELKERERDAARQHEREQERRRLAMDAAMRRLEGQGQDH